MLDISGFITTQLRAEQAYRSIGVCRGASVLRYSSYHRLRLSFRHQPAQFILLHPVPEIIESL